MSPVLGSVLGLIAIYAGVGALYLMWNREKLRIGP